MALRREIDHQTIPPQKEKRPLAVADIALHEARILRLHHRRDRRQIAGVSELVQADDPICRMSAQHIKDEVVADKASPASHDDRHALYLPIDEVTVALGQ